MGGVPAREIGAPVLGQIQLTIDEGMTQRGDIGKEDTNLTVFHTPGAPAILGGDTSGVASTFGKATFVNDEHREGCLVLGAGVHQGRRVQALADQRTQIVADPVFVPDSTREQTLYAIGTSLSGV